MHAAPPCRPGPALGDAPILVVEDDGLIRSALAGCLEDQGYEVLPFGESGDAIELLGRGVHPPVVITDVGLGPGDDGVALADEVHRLCPSSVVVFITGRYELLGERGLKDREFILSKPFRVEALVEVLGLIGAVAPTDIARQNG